MKQFIPIKFSYPFAILLLINTSIWGHGGGDQIILGFGIIFFVVNCVIYIVTGLIYGAEFRHLRLLQLFWTFVVFQAMQIVSWFTLTWLAFSITGKNVEAWISAWVGSLVLAFLLLRYMIIGQRNL